MSARAGRPVGAARLPAPGGRKPPDTLLAAWRRTVRSDPYAPAVIDAATLLCVSRSGLDLQAASWAEAEGRRAPDAERPGWHLFAEPNGPGWLRVFLGSLMLGRTAVPVDPAEPAEARARIADSLAAALANAGTGAAVVKVTSGSSGQPRALPFTHAQMLADGAQICATMKIRGEDVNLGLIPFGHSYGLGNLVVPLLLQGTAIVWNVAPLPHAIAGAARDAGASVFPTVPRVLQALADSDLPPDALRGIRLVISAGAPLEAATARRFRERFGLAIHNFYGSSETGGIAYDRTGEAALAGRAVGTPIEGVRLTFLGRNRFRVSSPAVGGNGSHIPADLGRRNARGELVLLGRVGRRLKIAGRRLDPEEVERALRELPGVNDCHVGVHPSRPEYLCAAVAGALPATALRRSLTARLAPWKIPRKWIVLPALPRNARGKLSAARAATLFAPPAAPVAERSTQRRRLRGGNANA